MNTSGTIELTRDELQTAIIEWARVHRASEIPKSLELDNVTNVFTILSDNTQLDIINIIIKYTRSDV